jgi:NADPH2 dehydrogenase
LMVELVRASLLDSLLIQSLHLKNRIVMAPMWTGKATDDGYVTDELVKHYTDRSENLGLQIVEATITSRKGAVLDRSLQISSDSYIPGLEKLVKSVHRKDTSIALQLAHGGGVAKSKLTGFQPIAPSALITPIHGKELPKDMTEDDIDEVIHDFRSASRRAYEAGFDAVEVHGAHYVLLPQFHSPLTNKRQDKYGGSLTNRLRLSTKTVKAMRKELGAHYPILYRLGVDDLLPGGLTLEDGVKAAKKIVEAGADVIDVSAGIRGHIHPTEKGPGFYMPLASAVKKTVQVPVIGVGGIKTAAEADSFIASGDVDLVAIGRAILSDPLWAKNAVKELSNKGGD